jgi:hypothetical protein
VCGGAGGGLAFLLGFLREIRVLDVVILWFLRGEMCGEDGQETMLKLGLGISQFFGLFYFLGKWLRFEAASESATA